MTGKTVSVDPVGAGLAALPTWARHRGIILYAVAPAQRLMDFHDSMQKTEQREYSRSWRPVLESIWSYAAGNDAAWYPISHAIGHYLLSPQNHIEGQDGPNDADDDEVAATIFAANAVLHGLVGFAELAAGRATDAIDNRWYGIDDDRLASELELENRRQHTALDRIIAASGDRRAWRAGAPASLLTALRAQ
jgi:hypothetical protein